MLDIRQIRENREEVEKKLNSRGKDIDLSFLQKKEEAKRENQKIIEELRALRNSSSDKIALLKKDKKDATAEIGAMQKISQEIKDREKDIGVAEKEIEAALLELPNLPHASVPLGKGAEENQEVRKWGQAPVFNFPIRSHIEIGEKLGILDFARGVKIAGTRFVLYKNLGAKLVRALINFMLDLHTGEHRYQEISPPLMVNPVSMQGTGQLPKFEAELFKLRDDDYFLIPTAEVPLTNIHREEILRGEELPIKYVAYTPCFRREAGSYGKETSGLIRQHQFDKVELVKFVLPEKSYEELEILVEEAAEVLRRLNIPYRVISLCSGDLGFSAAKTYDLEVWVPSQNTYREISSCSNFEDFQARRLKLRFKRTTEGKTELVHTLNGSGVAVGRLIVAILENYQQEDGSVNIPQALHKYLGGLEKIN